MSHVVTNEFDVLIVGGGPGGTTVASYLKKYSPDMRVGIVERSVFPRDHVGESQLPPIGKILHEIGAWEKIEAAGFPVKLGASYTWGKTTEPWVFGFIPVDEIQSTARPAKYEGWRTRVAMQVDRAKYDHILLEHARSLGAEILQPHSIVDAKFDSSDPGLAIQSLVLDDGRELRAKYYVDASGNAAILRRRLGIGTHAPTLLRNVAFWNYWSKPGLNKPLLESNAVRVMIRSVPFGWLWYIALDDDRTSVGLVCNAEYYKSCGKRPDELYREAIAIEPQISSLLSSATCRPGVEATTDWSFVSERAFGENWFLVGECLGFADPILAAGMTLTHTSAQHCAISILELERATLDSHWIRQQYQEIQLRRIRQHIRFAEYWYSANGLFSSVVENCAAIAENSGLKLTPQEAFRWLSHGGIDDVPGQFVLGGLTLAGIKSVQKRFAHDCDEDVDFCVNNKNIFRLNLEGATSSTMAVIEEGRILQVALLQRGEAKLPEWGVYGVVLRALRKTSKVEQLIPCIQQEIMSALANRSDWQPAFQQSIHCLEALASQGWVDCEFEPGRPTLSLSSPEEGDIVFTEKLGPRSKAR